MKLIYSVAFAVCMLSLSAGCADPTSANKTVKKEAATASATGDTVQPVKVGKFTPTILENGEASHITVQHVLIGFKGSVPGKGITRSKEDAEKLANEILAKAQAGEDFESLVLKHTDDSPPGVYHMANFGQDSDMNNPIQAKWVFPRDGMVGAFGNVGFPLKVGEVGLANYDTQESKYGWHIIKRLK